MKPIYVPSVKTLPLSPPLLLPRVYLRSGQQLQPAVLMKWTWGQDVQSQTLRDQVCLSLLLSLFLLFNHNLFTPASPPLATILVEGTSPPPLPPPPGLRLSTGELFGIVLSSVVVLVACGAVPVIIIVTYCIMKKKMRRAIKNQQTYVCVYMCFVVCKDICVCVSNFHCMKKCLGSIMIFL